MNMSTRAQFPGQVGESAHSQVENLYTQTGRRWMRSVLTKSDHQKLCSDFVWELLTRMRPELILTNEGASWGFYSVIAAALVIDHLVAPSWADLKYIYRVGSSGRGIQRQEGDLSQKCDRKLKSTQSVLFQAV